MSQENWMHDDCQHRHCGIGRKLKSAYATGFTEEYNDWFDQLRAIAVLKYQFGWDSATNLDKKAFIDYYENGYSPDEAMSEDMSYGDPE